ncbi:FAD-binding domain-containing protein [Algirhabdus cladophorae]|uniref:FAD-binding domain-containing protein n=1 Tax=Algirhabdus cladophorae TaxID=3377108 RepID=UPI003B846073
MTVVVWFKRDLRVVDHPALGWAVAQNKPILPLYIIEPDYWQLPDTAGRQWQFTAEAVENLDQQLRRLGSGLYLAQGRVLDVFADLKAQLGHFELVSHEETGNNWTFQRDRAALAWATENSVPWLELPQSGVVRRLAGRDGWAALRNRFLREGALDAPAALPPPSLNSTGGLPTAQDLRMAPDPCPARQLGGRDQALSLLGGFLTERGQTYRRAMSSPLEGEVACSRLSPHLALGSLSGREAANAGWARAAEVKGTRDGWIGAMKSFQSRLAWRDHFMQKLEDEPRMEWQCLHPAYEGLRPAQSDTSRLQAWQTGETGLPFVDACMRYLAHTGWLNFRMRSMVQAVASYHLWLDWRPTGQHLARRFTDYEPGIHWSQVQMQSGTTGMNTVRVYNPVKQGHDQDPTGVFTRRWVPELAAVPDQYLQEPWLWDGAGSLLGRHYPEPIVDVKAAAAEARAQVWGVRRGPEFRAKAKDIIEKHASRKDPQGHFVNDRAPRRKAAKPAPKDQLKFEF